MITEERSSNDGDELVACIGQLEGLRRGHRIGIYTYSTDEQVLLAAVSTSHYTHSAKCTVSAALRRYLAVYGHRDSIRYTRRRRLKA